MPSAAQHERVETPSAEELSAWLRTPSASSDASSRIVPWPRHRIARSDLLLAAVFFVLAIAARWPLIHRGETLLHSDEAIVGLMAQDISEGRRYPIYFYGQRYMGALEAYVIAALLPLFADPIHALRAGPAIFFGALVAAQYLMLTRWFTRRGGLIGALMLLAAPPMFAQWSISARGGYIEILLVGSLLLWMYGEWFVGSTSVATGRESTSARMLKRMLFGVILGLGLWINPSIALFVLPIAAHASLQRLPSRIADRSRLGIATLPIAFIAVVLISNCTWSVHVDQGRVHSILLLGLLPKPLAAVVIITTLAVLGIYLQHRFQALARLRRGLPVAGPMILGILIGASPALWYVMRSALGLRTLEPALPLGLRPLWTIDATLTYLWHGLPLLFGADIRPFLELVTIGRPSSIRPLEILTSGMSSGANWLVLGAGITATIALILHGRYELVRLLRMEPAQYSPTILLVIGAVGMTLLFLLSGATHDFNTIRYLIPLWAFLPGLAAAIFTQSKLRLAGRAAPIALSLAWAFGQYALWLQLGSPHPLRPLAQEMIARRIDPAVAEIFDAHLLSYLTQQKCRVAEFNPFWSRLAHYEPIVRSGERITYIVRTNLDEESDVRSTWRFPGPPPPELHHPLWTHLRDAFKNDPSMPVDRDPLPDGYERIVLRNERPSR